MDRVITYPGAVPLDTDLLNTNRNVMTAFSSAFALLFGNVSALQIGNVLAVDGFTAVPSSPAALSFVVSTGTITATAALDSAAYGSLGSDTVTPVIKQGLLTGSTTFPVTAPVTPGQTILYLLQVSLLEQDVGATALPYYDAANPSVSWTGPSNSGTAQPTVRQQKAQLQLKAGAAANTGTAVAPSTDVGWAPLWIISVSYGQTTVLTSHITIHPAAPYVPFKLGAGLVPGFSRAAVFGSAGTSSWTVPNGVTRVRATVVGGGGGGSNSLTAAPGGTASSGGGGGAGATAIGIYAVTPGQVISVTVGAGGGAQANGGTSSFGAFCSSTGGAGSNFQASTSSAGGSGGVAAGGNILNLPGGYGSDGQSGAFCGFGNGAPGPWGGAGRAAVPVTGAGIAGQGPGSGGGGSYNGTGNGGAGAAGIVVVEF